MKITLGDQTVLLAGSSLIAVVLFVWGLGPSCGTVGSWLGALRLCFSGGPFLLAFLGLFHQQCHATLCLSDSGWSLWGWRRPLMGAGWSRYTRCLRCPSPQEDQILDLTWAWRGVSGALFLCLCLFGMGNDKEACELIVMPLCVSRPVYFCVGCMAVLLERQASTCNLQRLPGFQNFFNLLRNLHTGAVVAQG